MNTDTFSVRLNHATKARLQKLAKSTGRSRAFFAADPQGAPQTQGGMKLTWSPESIHDLISLRADIAEHDLAAAKRVALHVIYCVEHLLSENPHLGTPGRVPGNMRTRNPENALHRALPNSRGQSK
jgi:plasmid stabilization system protein ParE